MATKPYSSHPDGIRLTFHLTPNAASEGLKGLDFNGAGQARIRATVTAAPEKGKANASLVKLLAKKLRLPKSSIQIIAGQHSREKSVLVTGAPDLIQVVIEGLLAELE